MTEYQWSLNSISKVNVIGTSGSGKSTFAKKLSSILDCPHIEMDRIYWGPQWTWLSDEEFFASLKTALQKPKWVLDGNYNQTIPIKWENVDVVVWLDYSFGSTLWQAVRRAVKRAWTQQELWEGTGNRESFRKSFFSKESIIWWTIKTHGKVRKKYEAVVKDPQFAHIRFLRLRNHSEADHFLNAVRSELSR